MNTVRDLSDNVDSLKKQFPNLSDFEALQIAVKMEYNNIIMSAFVINSGTPGALEAIAIQLGYGKGTLSRTTLPDVLTEIAKSLDK